MKQKALDIQVGGDHYKNLVIQPVQYIHANGIGYFEGNVIKYVSRWRSKNGIADLEKAKHYIDLLIEQEKSNGSKSSSVQQEPKQPEAIGDIRAGVPPIHPCRADDPSDVQPQRSIIASCTSPQKPRSTRYLPDYVWGQQTWDEQCYPPQPPEDGLVQSAMGRGRLRGSSFSFPSL